MESATENKPPMVSSETQVRVKRCGKSAPERLATALLVNPAGARPNRGDETARFAIYPG